MDFCRATHGDLAVVQSKRPSEWVPGVVCGVSPTGVVRAIRTPDYRLLQVPENPAPGSVRVLRSDRLRLTPEEVIRWIGQVTKGSDGHVPLTLQDVRALLFPWAREAEVDSHETIRPWPDGMGWDALGAELAEVPGSGGVRARLLLSQGGVVGHVRWASLPETSTVESRGRVLALLRRALQEGHFDEAAGR